MEFRKMVTITLCTRQQKRHRCIEQSFGRGLRGEVECAWPGEQSRVLSPNGRGGWTPLRPLRVLKRAADLVEALYGMPHNNQVSVLGLEPSTFSGSSQSPRENEKA